MCAAEGSPDSGSYGCNDTIGLLYVQQIGKTIKKRIKIQESGKMICCFLFLFVSLYRY